MKLLRSILLLGAALLPASALASTVVGSVSGSGGFLGISWGSGGGMCSGSICSIADTILYLINGVAVPLIFAVAFIVFIWGVFQSYIMSQGDGEKVKQGHQLILWGLIGFAVMISIWGLVNVVANTFGLTGYAMPALPQSY